MAMQVIMTRPCSVDPSNASRGFWQAKVSNDGGEDEKTNSRRGAWLHEPETRFDWWRHSAELAPFAFRAEQDSILGNTPRALEGIPARREIV